jgi:hypothetical protein
VLALCQHFSEQNLMNNALNYNIFMMIGAYDENRDKRCRILEFGHLKLTK